LFIHGGGWEVGTKSSSGFNRFLPNGNPEPAFDSTNDLNITNFCEYYKFVICSMNYRLNSDGATVGYGGSNDGYHPNPVNDVITVLRFINESGAGAGQNGYWQVIYNYVQQYGLLVTGISAGGHLAMMGAGEYGTSTGIWPSKGIANIVGPADLDYYTAPNSGLISQDAKNLANKYTLYAGQAALRSASPRYKFGSSSSPGTWYNAIKNSTVKFLFLHNTNDQLVPPAALITPFINTLISEIGSERVTVQEITQTSTNTHNIVGDGVPLLMTLALKNSLIYASDHTVFRDVFNGFWSTGSVSYGYGQTAVPDISGAGAVASASTYWSLMVDNLRCALTHQGTSYMAMSSPTAGSVITPLTAAINSNYQVAENELNRFNSISSSVAWSGAITSTASFNSTQTHTYTVSFTSHNRARYFFNSGGQFSISLTHPTAPMSTSASNLGTIRFGAGSQTIAGVGYTGTTKVGGVSDAYSTVSTTKNFYNITSSDTLLATQGVAGSTASVSLYVSYNGAGALTFKTISTAPSTNPTIAAGSTLSLSQRDPHTSACFVNTWGVVTTTNSTVTQTNAIESSESTIMTSWVTNRSKYVRSGMSPANYPGDRLALNTPHVRYYNAVFSEIFTYNTADDAAALSLANMSQFFTAITYVTGGLGGGRSPPSTIPIGTDGFGKTALTSVGEVYTIDGSAIPNNSGYYGLGYNISTYQSKLSDITSTYVTTYQGGRNDGSWNYQILIPGKWGIAKKQAEFNPAENRTLGSGRMALILYERGGNGNGMQNSPTGYSINYDNWWYNGGGMIISANPTGAAINLNLSTFNTNYSPRVYIELSKDGGAETPTSTTNPPNEFTPPFDPGPPVDVSTGY